MSRILTAMLALMASVIALSGLSDAANAQKRVALVIGNGAYTKVPRLDNPKNDAAAIEVMFKVAGFNPVVRINDLGVVAMRRALRDFSDTAHDAEIAVVFYAGHGIEVGGVNYLIPIDAVLERDTDAPDEAISLDRINQMLEPVKHLRLVILDACRDNPFTRSMRRTIATRSVRSGYGEIDERSLPPNTLVAYAQRAGSTAEDGVGSNNSPYTTALIKHLPTPGLDIELALRRVRDEVLRATKNRQEPFKYGSLSGTEVTLVAVSAGTATTTTKQGEPGGTKQLSEAAEAWAAVSNATNAAVLEAYIARYKDTFYAELARARINELKKQEANIAEAARKKTEEEARAKADAERQRLAMLQQENERKRAEAANAKQKTEKQPPEKGGTLAMELTTGTVKIRLRPDLAPKHVERVRLLAKEGFYNGLTFHRVIDRFMAQGGDPSGTGTGGSRHPNLPLEPSEVQFTRGTVAAARTSDPNSANSQFFICFNDSSCKQLSKLYTIWGEVIEGIENVDKLARGEPPAKPDKIISFRITE